MTNWVLHEVTKECCDICCAFATVNVYKRFLTCSCYKCNATHRTKSEYFNVCGYCFTEWAKSNSQYLSIDDAY